MKIAKDERGVAAIAEIALVAVVLGAFGFIGYRSIKGNHPAPTPAPTATAQPTATPTPKPSATPSTTPIATKVPVATKSPTPAPLSLSVTTEQAVLDGWMKDYLANNASSSAFATTSLHSSFDFAAFNGCHMQSPPDGLKASSDMRSQIDATHISDKQVSWYMRGDQSVDGPFYEMVFAKVGSSWLMDKITYLNCGHRQ